MMTGLSLISMGFGYKIWLEASASKKNTRVLGRAVAIVMMAGSLWSFICAVQFCGSMGGFIGKDGWLGRKMAACPMTGSMYGDRMGMGGMPMEPKGR